MKKIAIPKSLELTEEMLKGFSEFEFVEYDKETTNTIEDVSVWIGNPPKELPKNLEFLQLLSAGFEHIDAKGMKEKGIVISNGSGLTSQAISEYCLGAILMVYRGFPQFAKNQEKGLWDRSTSLKSLVGKTIVIMGTGNISEHIVRVLEPFNCTLYGINSNGRDIEGFKKCYSLSNRHEILKEADIVIMALPQNEATYHTISDKEIQLMKKDAILMNVGRGACVDMDAVLKNLDTHLSQVIFDVFEEEPLPEDHPIWFHTKAIVTPHNSYYSDHLKSNQQNLVLRNLKHIEKGEEPVNKI
ncbi:hypothetical protein G7059_02560 [Erysipelothrix sp. HDW6A]|uniref:NAD(P)-dependent oxidoreductase n=1 Tax=Erysipelothrix sp. HDW6A TaxID=2714928 RepID=UPI00140D7761|nr:NAD(P)-dependent oxidoreductase [Erysipelothrix sp. HDW6A]QIK56806.1 hypothetical protein G7059_02560 [Erysipelothrix sp. HDW6A]